MHVYQRNRKNPMQGHGARVIVCLVRHSLRNIPAVSANHVSGMDLPGEYTCSKSLRTCAVLSDSQKPCEGKFD